MKTESYFFDFLRKTELQGYSELWNFPTFDYLKTTIQTALSLLTSVRMHDILPSDFYFK